MAETEIGVMAQPMPGRPYSLSKAQGLVVGAWQTITNDQPATEAYREWTIGELPSGRCA